MRRRQLQWQSWDVSNKEYVVDSETKWPRALMVKNHWTGNTHYVKQTVKGGYALINEYAVITFAW